MKVYFKDFSRMTTVGVIKFNNGHFTSDIVLLRSLDAQLHDMSREVEFAFGETTRKVLLDVECDADYGFEMNEKMRNVLGFKEEGALGDGNYAVFMSFYGVRLLACTKNI